MPVRIIIKRHVKKECRDKVLKLLGEFRKQAIRQPGYISGETLLNHYDPNGLVVLSTWRTVENWICWQNSDERNKNEARIEALLDRPTAFEVYDACPPQS